jgi:hypothetical protein
MNTKNTESVDTAGTIETLGTSGPEFPAGCQDALRAIELDALNLPLEALKHVSACSMCSEARVLWLAQEDFGHQLAPAGYFDKLPSRVLQKLPTAQKKPLYRLPLLFSAASILLFVALSGYWYGRQSQLSPIILEAIVPPKDIRDPFLNDPTSFSNIELFSQVSDLTAEEANSLMRDLKEQEASVQPKKPESD